MMGQMVKPTMVKPPVRSSHLEKCSVEKVFSESWGLQLYQKRGSGTVFFLWILRNYQEYCFYRTPPGDRLLEGETGNGEATNVPKIQCDNVNEMMYIYRHHRHTSSIIHVEFKFQKKIAFLNPSCQWVRNASF